MVAGIAAHQKILSHASDRLAVHQPIRCTVLYFLCVFVCVCVCFFYCYSGLWNNATFFISSSTAVFVPATLMTLRFHVVFFARGT